jgi:DNA-binding NtrC family response regulator
VSAPTRHVKNRETYDVARPSEPLNEATLQDALDHLTPAGLATLLEWARREDPGLLRMFMLSFLQGRSFLSSPQNLPSPNMRLKSTNARSPSTESLRSLEQEHINRVVSESKTLAEAAARLGIHTTTLWRRLKYYKTRGTS